MKLGLSIIANMYSILSLTISAIIKICFSFFRFNSSTTLLVKLKVFATNETTSFVSIFLSIKILITIENSTTNIAVPITYKTA